MTVDDLRDLEPGLSATVMTLIVTLESTDVLVGPAVSDAFNKVMDVDIIVVSPD